MGSSVDSANASKSNLKCCLKLINAFQGKFVEWILISHLHSKPSPLPLQLNEVKSFFTLNLQNVELLSTQLMNASRAPLLHRR